MTRIATALVILGAVGLHGQTAPSPARPAPQTGTGVIRGRVTAADTALPIPNVRLSLTMSAGGSNAAVGSVDPTLSDSEGRFQFVNLPAGRYTVVAAKAGYLNSRFGARTYFDRPVNVVVVEGAIDDINMRLVKSAAISGRILDDLGDPAVGASVSVSRRERIDGRERLSIVKGTQTDDLGEYRIGGLPAGSFLVSVGGGGGTATRWTRTFFPGPVMLSRAQAISVGAGEDAGGRDFSVSPVGSGSRSVTLSGVVIGADGGVARGTLIHATVEDVAGTGSASSGRISPSGEFSFKQDEPGGHLLIARGATGDVAALRVFVADSDVTGLRLVLAKGGRMSGRVVFEGTTPPLASDVELEAWSADFDSSLAPSMPGSASPIRPVKANRDGTFELLNLFAARELRVRSAPPGWIVKSMTVEGRSIADTPIDFDGGRELAGVQVLMTDRAAQLTGAVTDGERRAIKEYSVVVFADDPSRARRPSRVAQWVRPDQNGRFLVDGLAPGAYLIAAVDQVTDDQWSNTEYLDELRPRATRVTLADGEQKAVSLERIAP